MNKPSQYRPDIDGLRAVAVLGVVLFHANLGFSGGYVGVDVFFVISGFLITRIILTTLDAGEFSLRNFWARRVCRILPASLAATMGTILAGSVILLPYDLHELGEAATSHVLMASNVYHWDQMRGYFAAESDLRPLLHTWSLAVEEQFYVFYPISLMALHRFRRRNTLLIFIGIASLVSSQAALSWDASASFFLLPTRAWELIAGGLVFTLGDNLRLNRGSATAFATAGLLLIGYAMFFYDSTTPFPGLNAIAPVCGTALIMLANRSQFTYVGTMLSCRPMVFIGLLSYSIYLWHWPILVYAHYILGESLSYSVIAMLLVLTAVLSLLSWQFVEKPFRCQVKNFRAFQIVGTGLSASLAVGLIGVLLVTSDGWPNRRGDDPLFTEDAGFHNSRFFTSRAKEVPRDLPRIGDLESQDSARVFLWGDSHGPPVADLLDELLSKQHLTGAVAVRCATAPIFSTLPTAAEWNDAVLEHIDEEGVAEVIIVSHWSGWLKDDRTFSEVQSRLKRLTNLGVRIWLLLQIPDHRFHVCRAIHSRRFGASLPIGSTLDEHKERQAIANSYLAQLESDQIRVLDPTPHFFDETGNSILGIDGRSFYRDDDHLSSFGAKVLLSPIFEDVIDHIARESPTSRTSLVLEIRDNFQITFGRQ